MSIPHNFNRIEPSVRIGKNGLSKSVACEIERHLKKKKTIKIKLLKSYFEGKDNRVYQY